MSVTPSGIEPATFRLLAFIKFKLNLDQRIMLVFALIARRLWKHFRLPKQRLPWYNIVKRRWMTSLTGTPWGCTGSLDMPEYVEMTSPTSSHGKAPLRSKLDLSRLLGILGGISVISLNAGWISSIWQCGVVLVVLRDKLKNWFRVLALLQNSDYCPSIGHNPGPLLAFLPDVTPWEDIYV
jgi:hypothetical protein